MQPAQTADVVLNDDFGASRALSGPSLRTVYGLAFGDVAPATWVQPNQTTMGPSLTNALTVTTAIGGRTSLCTPRQVRVPVGALSQAMRAMRQNGSAVIGVQRHSHVQSAPALSVARSKPRIP